MLVYIVTDMGENGHCKVCYNSRVITEVNNIDEMLNLGQKIGRNVRGRLVIELIGDVGAGKTTLTKGIASGMGVVEAVQSPTFNLNRLYEADSGMRLSHYDFYRLNDAGVMADELSETISDDQTVTVVEWSDVVSGVLPKDRLVISIQAVSDDSRRLDITADGEISRSVLESIS